MTPGSGLLGLPDGRLPRPGELFRNPDLADTLEKIARSGAREYYEGEIAEKIRRLLPRQYGGVLRREDLAEHQVQWVQPLSVPYHGYEVWELPPNGQGIIALMALNILNGFEPAPLDDPLGLHRQIEAIKLAFIDGLHYIGDPRYMAVSPEEMLSPAYGAARRRLITEKALEPVPGNPKDPGTVYLCAADNEGNMISYIQSNYAGFGSGIVIPGTGIAMQNRGKGFCLEPGHANAAAPGKRPYHTIIPGFLTKQGKPMGPFGVMGGFMQPQGHVQVLTKLIDCGLNPQAAIDGPPVAVDPGPASEHGARIPRPLDRRPPAAWPQDRLRHQPGRLWQGPDDLGNAPRHPDGRHRAPLRGRLRRLVSPKTCLLSPKGSTRCAPFLLCSKGIVSHKNKVFAIDPPIPARILFVPRALCQAACAPGPGAKQHANGGFSYGTSRDADERVG